MASHWDVLRSRYVLSLSWIGVLLFMLLRGLPYWLTGILSVLLLAGATVGCDIPTEPLSLETNTTVDVPLMDDKTFQFLGGPESGDTPLIDTTRTAVDSLLSDTTMNGVVLVGQELTHSNTFEADLSSLESITDSTKSGIDGTIPLRIEYTNGIPLRFDVRIGVLDGRGEPILSIPSGEEDVTLSSAPTAGDGRASSARAGHLVLDLQPNVVRALSRGDALRFYLTGTPTDGEGPARVRVDDTLSVSLATEMETTVEVGR